MATDNNFKFPITQVICTRKLTSLVPQLQ